LIAPTRKLINKELDVFNRVLSESVHLTSADAEQLTQYAEAVIRYETALKQTKKHPTISVPVINRSTGNVTGEKRVRNPAFVTLKEALTQMNVLARRLMIDAHSAEKRQRLLTKRSQAMAASESKMAADSAVKNSITEKQIQAAMKMLAADSYFATEHVLRQHAIWYLTIYLPSSNDPESDEDIYFRPA